MSSLSWCRALSALLAISAWHAASLADPVGATAAVPVHRFVALGPPGGFVARLTAHPKEGRLLYAVAPGGGAGFRLYRSLDAGETWSAPEEGLPFSRPLGGTDLVSAEVIVDPRHPEIAYAIVRLGARAVGDPRLLVFYSQDHGASWNAIDRHFDEPLFGALELFFPPSRPTTSWARHTSAEGTRFFRSRDRGRNWFEQRELVALPETALEMPPPTPRYRVDVSSNTIERSDDGGLVWRTTGSAPYHPVAVTAVVAGTPDGRVYLATSDLVAQIPAVGVFRSDDSGATWHQANDGLADLRVHAIVAPLDVAETVYAATPGGLFVSRDGAQTWKVASSPGRDVASVGRLAGGVLLAGDARSTDGGRSWSTAEELAGAETRLAVAGGDVVYAIRRRPTDAAGRLLRSDDAGATWKELPQASCDAVTVGPESGSPSAGPALYCFEATGSPAELVVRRSQDGGESFVELHRSPALEPQALAPVSPVELAANALDGGGLRLVAAANVGSPQAPRAAQLRISDDGGETWRAVVVPVEGVWLYDVLLTSSGGRILLATSGGVLASEDGGASWVGLSRGLELAGPIIALGEHEETDVLFAGATQTLYRSANGGATWQRFEEGLRGTEVHHLDVDEDSGILFVGTSHGVHARRLSTATCQPSEVTLCLRDGEFLVEVTWEALGAGTGFGNAVPITNDTGAFWFFEPENLELVVKVLEGCRVNGREWVFVSGLTDVATDLRVVRLRDGATRRYRRILGEGFPPVLDVEAFGCAPGGSSSR